MVEGKRLGLPGDVPAGLAKLVECLSAAGFRQSGAELKDIVHQAWQQCVRQPDEALDSFILRYEKSIADLDRVGFNVDNDQLVLSFFRQARVGRDVRSRGLSGQVDNQDYPPIFDVFKVLRVAFGAGHIPEMPV